MKNIKAIYMIWCLGWLAVQAIPVSAGANGWTQAGTGITAEVNAFAQDHGQSQTLYAGAQNGFYYSADGGQSWSLRGPSLVDRSVLSLAVDPENGDRLYAGLNTGLFQSADGGESWAVVDAVGPGVLAVGTGAEGRVYAATFGRGVFTSLDAGVSWVVAGSELESDIIFALAAHPLQALTVYAGTARGLFESRDGGESWVSAGEELDGLSVRDIYLSADPQDAGRIVVATYGAGIWLSGDDGQTWQTANDGLGDLNARSVEVDPDVDQLIYAATANGGFYRSKDGGANWNAVNDGLDNLTTRWVAVVTDGRILGGGVGNGIQEIRFEPEAQIRLGAAALDFGMVSVGVPSVQTLDIVNDGQVDLVISNFSIDRQSVFSVSPATATVTPGGSVAVEVRFQPTVRGMASTVLVARSNDPDEDAVSVALSGTGVLAELSVQPAVIAFGEVRVGSFLDTTVILTNIGNAALKLRNAFIENASFRILNFQPQTLAPNQSLGVTIRFLPLVARGMSAQLVVVDAVGRNEIGVDGVGTAPDISVSSWALDFGTVDLQSSKTVALSVSNSGNIDLNILELRLDGEAFRIDVEAPITVASGQVQEINVTFLPLAAGEDDGSLQIESDAPGRLSSAAISLKGAGGALALRPLTELVAGVGPADMLVVDLDQDGALDLAIADSASGQLRVLFNDGTGLFLEAVVYPGASSSYGDWDQPVTLAAAAIFGNGLDLVVGDPVARSISILQNDGMGFFDISREDIFIGHQIADVLTADLDADGDFDIAVANRDAASVTVLFNNGEGSFNARITCDVEAGPTALLATHLDPDEHADLVVANSTAGTISVLFGNRNGGFETRQDFVVGIDPAALSMADYDADGDNDVLVGSRGSRDVAILQNDGAGGLTLVQRINVGVPVVDLALTDLTADIFSDLVVASSTGSHLAFFENEAGTGFVSRDILTSQVPVRRVGVADLNADGANDIVALFAGQGLVQVFLNEDARRLDAPRPPTGVSAADVGRDLGRNIEVVWEAPALDEQIGRTTEYMIFRSTSSTGPFAPVDTLAAGQRRYVDVAATLADTFYYYVVAGNALLASDPSEIVAAASRPAPFFELQIVDGSRFSVGDTLKLRAFITPAEHDIAGLSLFMSYEDSALTLIDADEGLPAVQPFRVEAALSNAAVLENRLQPLQNNKMNLSLAQLDLNAGVEPVELGEIWFLTSVDTVTFITIDDEPASNRRSSVVEARTGEWILPFIPERPTQVSIRDFQVQGQIQLEGRALLDQALQISLFFVGIVGDTLESPLNDEDRLRSGIQYTLAADGSFSLVQIPKDTYHVLAKAPTHLQGLTDTISVGTTLRTSTSFSWVSVDSISQGSLPAGDANDDNSINLADFGVFVRHFGTTSAEQVSWTEAVTADFNGDESINIDDFFLLAQNFGAVGMQLLAPTTAAQRPAAGKIELLDGQVHLQQEGQIVGFSLLTTGIEAIDFTTSGTIWAGRQMLIQHWPEEGNTRIVGALFDQEQPLAAAGILAIIEGSTDVLEVELLRPDGQVERLIATRAQPRQSALLQNFPNPFNPTTTIPFAVGSVGERRMSEVRLDIFNMLGQQVRTVVAGALPAGMHRVEWDGRDGAGRDVASGSYLYRLQVGEMLQSRRLMLVR